ncbi:Gfo/Idh/MocA family protein [Natronosalvus rutilus]|uniref:Gfo/Idh/MocA family oxidoreductase n=1 Tax=Natronosalvus rutilus TaxID=2953753 RepID=A0A9E7SWC5_9EURY|nr:Gfo/Idh/MocA family oxidoreductase [Natronosalvus rutilus]UTF54897.1 Gfo/Idh/MocA family oxidoreductase [Natronosalvus rutilus]
MVIGIGVIGLGGLAHVESDHLDSMPEVDLVGGADSFEAARDAFESAYRVPTYPNYQTLLENHEDQLDAALIVTPHTLHYEHASACLERDLHVFVEKPMVTAVADAIDLVETAADRDLVLQVGYQRHFHPAFQEIRRVVSSGRIGTPHTVSCSLDQEWVTNHEGTWRVNPDLSGGGQLYDTGSHLFDALLWMTNSTPKTVTAQVEFVKPGIDVNSALTMTLDRDGETIRSGISVSGDGIANSPFETYAIWGTDGRLTYRDDRLTIVEKGRATYRATITEGAETQTLTRKKLENFVASIHGDVEPAVPGDVGLQITALTEAIYEAAEDGCSVDVQTILAEPQDS